MAKPDVGARRLPPTRPTRAHHPRGTLAVALSTKGELAGPANGTPWGGSIVGPYPHVQCEAGPHAALSQKGPLAFAQTSVFAHDWAWRPMVNPAISNLISLKFDNFYCQAGSSGHCSLYSYWMSSTALVRDGGGGANRRHDYPMTDPSNGSAPQIRPVRCAVRTACHAGCTDCTDCSGRTMHSKPPSHG